MAIFLIMSSHMPNYKLLLQLVPLSIMELFIFTETICMNYY